MSLQPLNSANSDADPLSSRVTASVKTQACDEIKSFMILFNSKGYDCMKKSSAFEKSSCCLTSDLHPLLRGIELEAGTTLHFLSCLALREPLKLPASISLHV